MSATESKPPDETSKETGTWSEADKRLLLITFLGGLGANIGVVLIVGMAIAFLRFVSGSDKSLWSGFIFVLLGSLGGAGISVAIHSKAPGLRLLWIQSIYRGTWVLLLAIGYAAGIGK